MYSFDNLATLTPSDTALAMTAQHMLPVVVTLPPVVVAGCTYTQGYWKTHNVYGPGKGRTARKVGP